MTRDTHRNVAMLTVFGTLLAGFLVAGCDGQNRNGKDRDEASPDTPLREDMSWGAVSLDITIDPPHVHLDRDTILTLTMETPSEVDASFPALGDRVAGFTISGTIDRDPVAANGKTRRVRRVRLTPIVAAEYRLAPMALEYTDRSTSPPRSGWFPTRPIVLERAGVSEQANRKVAVELKPRWIYPPFRTIATWVIVLLGLAGLAVLLWKLWPRLKRAHQLRRMSPSERALFELAELLARDLLAHDLPKDFYVELTMIVRRYIERRHTIKAPEQTTQEFLAAIGRDTRFAPEVITKLRRFLEAADLVKFAAQTPTTDAANQAVTTAREYITTDSQTDKEGEDR